tara:strand:+ start:1002 stop:3191 length:2190 start_codon:yes stop_codon:yes gene_type:complete
MAVYKQFNTNEVVVSPFNANKRFRFENNQVSSSDVQIEYYQSQQGTYLSGSFDTGFNTMQDGVTIFSSIKQLYYSNYLTSSIGDPFATGSLIPGPIDPKGNSLGFDQIVGNTTGPRFDNFLQSSLTQDRKFAQFSSSKAPLGYAGTNTQVSQSAIADYQSFISATELSFVTLPDLLADGINETYILSHVEYTGGNTSPFTLTTGGTVVSSVSASQLVEERINPDVNGTLSGLTLKNNTLITIVNGNAATNDDITLHYIQAPRGPSVIAIPSMLYGEAIQPSSFQFEYTSSINFTRSIVDDDGQGNLIVTQSNSTGVPFFSGSVGQIFYSQGIAVITGPDSGSLREFAHNVGYKNNMNPNIMSSSISYSSSITIDENQYKCVVRDSEFGSTTNPSALGTSGELTKTDNQLFQSFDSSTIAPNPGTYAIRPRIVVGDIKATTFYVFGNRATTTTIGQQYRVELISSQGTSLEFVGWDGNGNGSRNALGQVQFNSTGSAAGVAQGFCNAINSVNGFNNEISASLQTEVSTNDTVMLTQGQPGTAGNTIIWYADSFNLLLNSTYQPNPSRGQGEFGNRIPQPAGNPIPTTGTDLYKSTNDKTTAILNVGVNASSEVQTINVSSSNYPANLELTLPQTFAGSGYQVGDKLEILGSELGGGTGFGYINLSIQDIDKANNTEVYHDFITGSEFSPYVTTVGLYNANHDLIVVGKFPRPLPISLNTDTTYIINFDTN